MMCIGYNVKQTKILVISVIGSSEKKLLVIKKMVIILDYFVTHTIRECIRQAKGKKMITFHYTGGLEIIIIITNIIIIIIIQLITNILLTMISSLSSLFWIIQPKIDLSSTHKMYYELILSSQLKLLYNNKDDDDNNSYGFFPLL